MKTHRRAGKIGFSLVEVVVAMGIVTFSLVAMLGLMPVGLSTLRQSMDRNAEAQILGQISSELFATSFDRLGEYAGKSPYYFDGEGQPVPSAQSAIYSAVVRPPKAPSYPGVPAGMQTSLADVQVEISSPRSQLPGQARIQSIYVAKSDPAP